MSRDILLASGTSKAGALYAVCCITLALAVFGCVAIRLLITIAAIAMMALRIFIESFPGLTCVKLSYISIDDNWESDMLSQCCHL